MYVVYGVGYVHACGGHGRNQSATLALIPFSADSATCSFLAALLNLPLCLNLQCDSCEGCSCHRGLSDTLELPRETRNDHRARLIPKSIITSGGSHTYF